VRVEKVFARWGALEASVLVCYGDELVLGLWPAGLFVYNGSEWRRLLTLPLNIHDVEIFGESIYLACNSPALPLKHGYSTSYCCVLKLPIDALGPL